jgi:2,4-dienoyl-CoA reductase-like NADH-dependent reductase (Old Yellow Enzyme family)
LPHQFIDNTSNHRTDEWGGTVENRCRFTLRAIDEITSVFGNDRVGIKLSPGGGYNDMGMNVKDTVDTYAYLIKELNARRLAYIQLVRYSALIDPARRGIDVDVFQWRNLIDSKHTALFANAGYDAQQGVEALKNGSADAIAYGRDYISNPDLADRLIHGKPLNTNLDFKTLYGGDNRGYTDYPTYDQSKQA